MKKNMDPYRTINLASKYTEIHLIMTQFRSKHVVINANVYNLSYYLHLNCCVDGYKYTVLNNIKQDVTRKECTALSGNKG
jgi:hypothetical protein